MKRRGGQRALAAPCSIEIRMTNRVLFSKRARALSALALLASSGLCVVACDSDDAGHNGTGNGGAGAETASPDPGAVAALPAECGERPIVGGAGAEFSKATLLTAAADCATWHYCEFERRAITLEAAVRAHAHQPSDTTLEPARAAWRDAMLRWGGAELFQFGPAGSRAHDLYHGASFRDRIYAWPSVSRCRVEEQLVSGAYAEGFDRVLVGAKGLYALEYLLFYPGADTACAPASATATTWATLAAEDIASRKRAYAAAVAADVLGLVRALRAAWHPSAGNFRQTLIDARGYENPGSDRDQEALNIVAWSLVYAEKEVKDYKIGPFTGLTLPLAPVDGFEAPHAGITRELVVANLEGVRSLYRGCGAAGEGAGFDDWLLAANHGELATAIDTALDAALDAVRAFPPFAEASEAQFATLYDDGVKPLTDLLKNDLLAGNGSALNLSLPASAAADND